MVSMKGMPYQSSARARSNGPDSRQFEGVELATQVWSGLDRL